MKTFELIGQVTISIYTEVEADTLEEAMEIAEGRSIEASNYDSSEQRKECWVSDEYDGMPQEIREA